jgi:hypothetical protein
MVNCGFFVLYVSMFLHCWVSVEGLIDWPTTHPNLIILLLCLKRYGDLCPTTTAGRLFTCFFGLAGVAFLGAAVATICSTFVQAEVDAVRKVETLSKRRLLNLFGGMPEKVKKFRSSSQNEQKRALEKTEKREKRRFEMAARAINGFAGLVEYLPSMTIIFAGGSILGYLNGGWSFVQSIYYSVITGELYRPFQFF